jgi:hypothetical protein
MGLQMTSLKRQQASSRCEFGWCNGEYPWLMQVASSLIVKHESERADPSSRVKNQDTLLQDIAELQRWYYTNLTIKDPTQIVNLKSWINRVNDCLQLRV